ncbi:MAG: phosphoenolpyruvate carboxykinase (ATP) [Thaumarchaeota archaeon 13_1_40CM_38_12]|nr:MAG: phosphoenolpyruvate carboxykinase (ATP) [Thaumarchaeota archaeon 13_1_40CM_38_12]
MGLEPEKIYRNLQVKKLIDIIIEKNEGTLAENGAISIKTGKYTGRSPDDRFIVDDKQTHDSVDWGKINHPFQEDKFDKIFEKMKRHVKGKEIFIFDGFVGADLDHRLSIRIITDHAWQSLFVRQLFIRPSATELQSHKPEYTLMALNEFKAIPEVDGTRTEAFILLSYQKKIVLIGATPYAGEIKKSMFSVMNYILPPKNVFPMHCSANIGKDGDTALFFGLSGTGKTSLSADSNRMLIGDDEHGWSDKGIFNFEGGCYAKCINLKKEAEPQIWDAIRSGSVLENVVLDKKTMMPDFDDGSITENTRAAYPLDYIPGSVIPSLGGNPKVIIFLTADAFGVMSPIAKLTKEGAMYHFMSGYTSKLAGTERGITEPRATFSECFGAPFMSRHASVYAKLLGEKITKHKTVVYLINTGWSGGPYGIGKRMNIHHTRRMVTAALTGELDIVKYRRDGVFNLDVPTSCPDVPSEVLDPRNTWSEKDAYDHSARKLAQMFVENFKKFGNVSKEIRDAGPQI